ncbi:MAG: hypothetical protein FD130_1787 [Halothiobacillaceae bacterium]|nr:MAG: hypothetical protein FD130_1787 [Halothiobacillaceae bacterium]
MLRRAIATQEMTAVAVLLLLVGATWWYLGRSVPTPERTVRSLAAEPDAFLKNFTLTAMDERGLLQQQLVADKMVHFTGSGESEVSKPHLTLYREQQNPWEITAERGWFNTNGDRALLQEQVVMEQMDKQGHPLTLQTRDLTVIPKKNYAETDAAVTVTSHRGVIRGVGLRAYLKEGRLSLLANVKGRYEPQAR